MKRTECIEAYGKEELDLHFEAKESKTCQRFTRPYILYCVMTLSVMLFTLAFAASEIFSLFFSEGYPGQMFLSKFFGFYATDAKSFKEILLETSFMDLSFTKENDELSVEITDVSSDNHPDKKPVTSDKEQNATESVTTAEETESSKNIYEYFPSDIPNGMHGIIPMDLSLSEYGNAYINSSSKLDFDLGELEKYDFSIDTGAIYPHDSPLVLVVHTHGSEAYTEEDVNWYDSTKEVSRSYDTDKNVVAIGRIFSSTLNSLGIPTIHCEIMHDAKSYSGAYAASAETVNEYLKKYPSIQYVIDIHRDAVVKSSGELVKAVCLTSEGQSAQIMCVVGTGTDGTVCKNWERNLALAQKMRVLLNTESENLCRPTCLRDSSYNQQYAAYSMLLEIGSAGNTLKESSVAAVYAAQALALIVKE